MGIKIWPKPKPIAAQFGVPQGAHGILRPSGDVNLSQNKWANVALPGGKPTKFREVGWCPWFIMFTFLHIYIYTVYHYIYIYIYMVVDQNPGTLSEHRNSWNMHVHSPQSPAIQRSMSPPCRGYIPTYGVSNQSVSTSINYIYIIYKIYII